MPSLQNMCVGRLRDMRRECEKGGDIQKYERRVWGREISSIPENGLGRGNCATFISLRARMVLRGFS